MRPKKATLTRRVSRLERRFGSFVTETRACQARMEKTLQFVAEKQKQAAENNDLRLGSIESAIREVGTRLSAYVLMLERDEIHRSREPLGMRPEA